MEEIDQVNLIKDKEHLKLLSIFHVIYGILTVAVSLFFIFYAIIFNYILSSPEYFSNVPHSLNSQIPPQQIFQFITVILTILIIIGCLIGISNILSAYYIKKRKFRVFSIIIAANTRKSGNIFITFRISCSFFHR